MLTLMLCLAMVRITGSLFSWIEFDDRHDFIVGFSTVQSDYDPVIPICIGALVKQFMVLAPGNPIQEYAHPNRYNDLRVHAIDGAWNKFKEYEVKCITTTFFGKRESTWLPHGFDGLHSPLHDLLVVFVDQLIAPAWTKQPLRQPYQIRTARFNNRQKITKNWMYSGFGYIDKDHVTDNNQLEYEYLTDNVEVDCDEYAPREWGHFICILDPRNYYGVSAGSPLLQRGVLFGLGSFALQQANESILFFTDVRPYTKHFGVCLEQDVCAVYYNFTHPVPGKCGDLFKY